MSFAKLTETIRRTFPGEEEAEEIREGFQPTKVTDEADESEHWHHRKYSDEDDMKPAEESEARPCSPKPNNVWKSDKG